VVSGENNIMKNNISENAKKLRSKKKISLEKVARFADVSLNMVIKIESGANKNPTIETLTKIAKAFGVPVIESFI